MLTTLERLTWEAVKEREFKVAQISPLRFGEDAVMTVLLYCDQNWLRVGLVSGGQVER